MGASILQDFQAHQVQVEEEEIEEEREEVEERGTNDRNDGRDSSWSKHINSNNSDRGNRMGASILQDRQSQQEQVEEEEKEEEREEAEEQGTILRTIIARIVFTDRTSDFFLAQADLNGSSYLFRGKGLYYMHVPILIRTRFEVSEDSFNFDGVRHTTYRMTSHERLTSNLFQKWCRQKDTTTTARIYQGHAEVAEGAKSGKFFLILP